MDKLDNGTHKNAFTNISLFLNVQLHKCLPIFMSRLPRWLSGKEPVCHTDHEADHTLITCLCMH